ncbi:MAG: DNA mismatch repair endonuclease MutL [Clostridia bacterium]|nr:DNA mismatch repair endonuclease MutL [Clostridia bacterium]
MKIKLLDASVANKIAAGEVVERPASIVKELVENSIDAGSTSVTIEIKGGGIDFIRITDNGCGMEEEDVKNAFLRHATSKISASEDLNNILTLGFRGEALASIAAVAFVQLSTRTKDAVEGTLIELLGGEIERFFPCGCAEGTSITVKDLFFNTPARRKFLKKPSQEAASIADVVNKLALSNPQIAIRFISEGKTVLRTPGDSQLLSCIRAIFGSDVSSNMIEVNAEKNGICLKGYIGNREIQRANRSRQYLFINGRSVKNDTVSSAVAQGYAGRLNIGKFPFFVLEMSVDGTMVDVNVHPTKQEVRFADGLPVFQSVYSIISSVLGQNQEIPTLFKKESFVEPLTRVEQVNSVRDEELFASDDADKREKKNTQIFVSDTFAPKVTYLDKNEPYEVDLENYDPLSTLPKKAPKEPENNGPVTSIKEFQKIFSELAGEEVLPDKVADGSWSPISLLDLENNDEDFAYQELSDKKEEKKQETFEVFDSSTNTDETTQTVFETVEKELFTDYKLCGVLFDTYLVVQQGDDAYLIDQHAAHERILFERLYAQMGADSPRQPLLFAQNIRLSAKEREFLEELIPDLEEMGFEIEDMGFGSFAVKSVPMALEGADAEKFITSLLDESGKIKILRTNELKRNKLMTLACRSAVKGGDKLNKSDIEHLLKLIKEEGVPLSCPHGRPILIRLSKHELEVRFKRIQ